MIQATRVSCCRAFHSTIRASPAAPLVNGHIHKSLSKAILPLQTAMIPTYPCPVGPSGGAAGGAGLIASVLLIKHAHLPVRDVSHKIQALCAALRLNHPHLQG